MTKERAKRNTFNRTTTHGAAVSLLAPIFTLKLGALTETFDVGKLPTAIQQRFFDHGWSTIGDAMAKPQGTPDAEKLQGARDRWAQLMAGEWTAERKALTAEEKYGILKEKIGKAWVSLAEGRTMEKFAEMVAGALRKAQEKNPKVVEKDVVENLAKHEKIILARARLEGGEVTELDVEMDV